MSRRIINLKAKPAFAGTCRSLLRNDWDAGTMRRVVRLLDAQLRASGVRLRLSAGDFHAPRPERPGELSIGPRELEELLRVFERVGAPQLPAASPTVTGLLRSADNETAAAALRASVYLAFQALFDVRGETGFFRDLQSLLYLHVVDWLLPRLGSTAFIPQCDFLVSAMGYHCTAVWRDNPAHQQYLISVLAGYLGDREREKSALLASFRLTAPESHEYLTSAQCYWSFLLENRRLDDAEAFLLGLYRRAPRESLAEIREMLDDTFAQRAPLAT
jgi:hypothetical protein